MNIFEVNILFHGKLEVAMTLGGKFHLVILDRSYTSQSWIISSQVVLEDTGNISRHGND